MLNNNDLAHPWMFGPIILHMSKKEDVFRRLALEMIAVKPELQQLNFLGTDMERAIYLGFKSVMSNLRNISLC